MPTTIDLVTVNLLHAFMAENGLSVVNKNGLFLVISPDGTAVTGQTWPNLFDALSDARSAIDTAKGKDRSTVAVSIVEALQSGFYYVVPSKANDHVSWTIHKSENNAPLPDEPVRASLSAALLRIVDLVGTKKTRQQ